MIKIMKRSFSVTRDRPRGGDLNTISPFFNVVCLPQGVHPSHILCLRGADNCRINGSFEIVYFDSNG